MTLSFAAACILKVTAVFALAWLASHALHRSSAAIRHSIWATAVMAALTLPAFMWTLPEWRAKSVAVKPIWQSPQPAIIAGSPYANVQASTVAVRQPSPVAASTRQPWTSAEILALLWAAGASITLLRLILGVLRVRAISATPLSVDALRGVQVLRAKSDSLMPLTWGLYSPRILFPANVSAWPEERFRHVLAHELAHIERRDWIVHIAGEIMRAVYWFHPLAWLAVSRLRQEAERACDDIVLRGGANASDYASHLLVLAQTLKSPAAVVSSTLAAAWLSSFERRVTARLSSTIDRRPVSRRTLAVIAVTSLAVLGPLASLAPGQEIRGVVIEPGTNHGLADAQITVRKMGPRITGQPIRTEEIAKLKTDAQGAFVFKTSEFGEYFLLASKEGYSVPVNLYRGIPSSQVNVILDKDNTSKDVQFSLSGRGTITGRIVDVDTNQPISGFRLNGIMYTVTNGMARTSAPNSGSAITDAQGMFRMDVTAGPHVIEIRPQTLFYEGLMKTFTPEDIAKTDVDYRRRYFPGGAELTVALPVGVPSGGSVDFGTIRIRKEPFFRVHVKTAGQCKPGETVRLTETMEYEGTKWGNDLGEVSCGSDFLVRNVEPGHYVMAARIGTTAQNLVRASKTFEIRESNLEFALTLERGPDLTGRVFAADGNESLPFEKFQLMFRPINGSLFADDLRPGTPDSKGQFRLENILQGHKQLSVSGLGNQYYVKQVRYRGLPAPGGIFNFTGEGSVEVEIDSQPAAISGSVRFRDGAVSGADVVLIRWPMVPADDLTIVRHIAANSSGNFQVTGLAPGEYRIFAVRNEDRDFAEAPSAWQGLVSRAEKLELTRGASPSLTLTPADLSR